MPKSKQKKKGQLPKPKKVYTPKFTPKCTHNYIQTNGIITCSKCDMKAILYLT